MAETHNLPTSLKLELHKICDITDYFERYEALFNLIGSDPRIEELYTCQQ